MVQRGTEHRHVRVTRCATAPALVTRMREQYAKPQQNEISINEVCRVADQERAHSARGSRRDVLESAYDNLINGIYSLPQSRPSTAFTCPVRSQRECHTARSVRSEPSSSVIVKDMTTAFRGRKSLLQQQCDDVIPTRKSSGSGKIVTSSDRCGKADKALSSIDISLEDFTCATRAKKFFPELSLREVYDKIQNGEIAKCFFPSPKVDSDAKIRNNNHIVVNSDGSEHVQNKNFMKANMFFLNIRDLNFKIASGKAKRDWGFTISKLKKQNLFNGNSSIKTFVSPKHFRQDEPDYKTFYDPPLVPRVQQKSSPVFFAGHSLEYKLPERLPEKIVFVKTVDLKLTQRRTSRNTIKSPTLSDEEPLDYEALLEDKLL